MREHLVVISAIHSVCIHTPVMLFAWSKVVGRVRRRTRVRSLVQAVSRSHRAAGWGRSNPGAGDS